MNIQDYIIRTCLGIILITTAIQDIRYKRINTWIIISGFVIIVICMPFSVSINLMERSLGLLTGLSLMGISKATGGKIGMGDGMLLCVSGVGLGFWANLELFAIGLFLAAVVSIILLIIKRVNRKYSIPFVPFLLMGYIIQTLVSKPWTVLI